MDGVHEDHMDVDVQVFMDGRARLARGSHGWRTRGLHERARLARGSHRCACMRFPWMVYERSKDDALQEEK